MLAATFQLYFKETVSQRGCPANSLFKPDYKTNGWLNGYKDYFAHHYQIQFDDSPADFKVLEEIILARNRVQHPESITRDSSHYSFTDLEKLPHPFFINSREESFFYSDIEEGMRSWLIPPTVHITHEKLFFALSEVNKFVEWLETVKKT
ncbi:MAG: hypothetical protein HOP21_07940 [Methylotenera sp.]|nr:hypothetical protein [Methylotenera sp.]